MYKIHTQSCSAYLRYTFAPLSDILTTPCKVVPLKKSRNMDLKLASFSNWSFSIERFCCSTVITTSVAMTTQQIGQKQQYRNSAWDSLCCNLCGNLRCVSLDFRRNHQQLKTINNTCMNICRPNHKVIETFVVYCWVALYSAWIYYRFTYSNECIQAISNRSPLANSLSACN